MIDGTCAALFELLENVGGTLNPELHRRNELPQSARWRSASAGHGGAPLRSIAELLRASPLGERFARPSKEPQREERAVLEFRTGAGCHYEGALVPPLSEQRFRLKKLEKRREQARRSPRLAPLPNRFDPTMFKERT